MTAVSPESVTGGGSDSFDWTSLFAGGPLGGMGGGGGAGKTQSSASAYTTGGGGDVNFNQAQSSTPLLIGFGLVAAAIMAAAFIILGGRK